MLLFSTAKPRCFEIRQALSSASIHGPIYRPVLTHDLSSANQVALELYALSQSVSDVAYAEVPSMVRAADDLGDELPVVLP